MAKKGGGGLPRDYARCTNGDCPERESCARWVCGQREKGEEAIGNSSVYRTSMTRFPGGRDGKRCPHRLSWEG